MKEIKLTQGQVAIVDDCNYEWLMQWKWCANWYESTKSFRALRGSCGKLIYMSRQIMDTPKGLFCDHINHNTLDNREENLRNVTFVQNHANRRECKKNKLKEKNIHRNGEKFRVQISKDGKMVFNKLFTSLSDAVFARDEAIKKIQGDFSFNAPRLL